jgi:hypothetical protein
MKGKKEVEKRKEGQKSNLNSNSNSSKYKGWEKMINQTHGVENSTG